MTPPTSVPSSGDVNANPISGLLDLLKKLRRYRVGLIRIELDSIPTAFRKISRHCPDIIFVDLLQDLTGLDIERLTAGTIADLVTVHGQEATPRIVLNFESLFTTLDLEAQVQTQQHLALAEPWMPCLLVLSSAYSWDRLQSTFANRVFHWPRN